jgi:hypothetical protein
VKNKTRLSIAAAILSLASFTYANDPISKQTLKSNYQLVNNNPSQSIDTFADMFKEGLFYGRLRSNTFLYDWEEENEKQNSHIISGLGGSLVYKSATFYGVDFTTGLYYSKAFFDSSSNPVESLKSGKDVLSRYDYTNGEGKSMAVLGQAYISYKNIPNSKIHIGRQLVETFYTKSNDTKMIPNTFDGVVAETKIIPRTQIKLAYLTKQKLRDHTTSHSVLMYDDSNPWNGNDDSAMHKGLSYTNLSAAGVSTDAPLITGDIKNRHIKNLNFDASFYWIPELLSEIMAEANYKIDMNGFTLAPGFRYIKQFDNGGGKIGGANYDGSLAGIEGSYSGYKDADSLDSQMIAARLVGVYDIYKLNLAYSKIFDEADLVTPWRGFPTSGYTRSMARYNWKANTKSYRAELSINANQNGVYKDLFIQLSALHTDADEQKGEYDENYYYAGFIQNIPCMTDLQWRLRLGYTDTKKRDADSLDARLEFNYLF